MSLVSDMHFESALLFLIVLVLIPALLQEWRGRRRGAAVPMLGLEYLRRRRQDSAGSRRILRSVSSGLLILGLGLLWSAPVMKTAAPVFDTDEQTQQKNLMVAIDVSRSMSGPLEMPDAKARLEAYGLAPQEDAARQSRFEAARETVYRFIDHFPNARIGLILFSTEPFLARWPTTETKGQFREILEDDLRGASQLRRFSSLTNTDAALQLARNVFATQVSFRGGAVIHISDAEDELENMGVAIRALRKDGIRLYTIGVGISESVASRLSQEFAEDPGFRIFRVDSERDMHEAYRLVSELEESPRFSADEKAYVSDLRWVIALVMAIFALVTFLLLEMRWHRAIIVVAHEPG